MWERLHAAAVAMGLARPACAAGLPRTVAIFRITQWPELGTDWRTARALRALSVMSVRPVTLRWVAANTGWGEARARHFLAALEDAHCLWQSEITPLDPP